MKKGQEKISTNNCVALFHSSALIFSLHKEANRFNKTWLFLCAAVLIPYYSWTDKELNEEVLVLSGALLNFAARVNQRLSTCGSRPPNCFAKVWEGVQKIPSNFVSGKVVELVLLKGTRLTNHILCFVDRVSVLIL